MITKKGLIVAFLLLIAIFVSSPVNTASAQFPLFPFLSFAGINERIDSIQLNDAKDEDEKAVPQQFLNGSAIMAMNVSLPDKKTIAKSAPKTYFVPSTAYSSTKDQTDSTPFITAFGTQVRDGIVATNYLPKGTKVRFPDLYGDKVFVVEDRMNIRYQRHVDIWSPDKEFSKNFGARYLRMEIL